MYQRCYCGIYKHICILYNIDVSYKHIVEYQKIFKIEVIIIQNKVNIVYVHSVQGERMLENVCGIDNGGCSNLCLRSPKGFTCACPTGIKFENTSEPTNKTCQKYPEEFLVIASKGSITYISFDTPEYRDVTFPVKEAKNTLSLDFHWKRKEIYYTDVDLDVIRYLFCSKNMNSLIYKLLMIKFMT